MVSINNIYSLSVSWEGMLDLYLKVSRRITVPLYLPRISAAHMLSIGTKSTPCAVIIVFVVHVHFYFVGCDKQQIKYIPLMIIHPEHNI